MKPPYTINAPIIQLIIEISQKIGELNSSLLIKQAPALRKRNRIRTIQASLAIEGNTLSIDQITAIIENKRVLGPVKDIKEVTNAVAVYNQLHQLKPNSEKSFLSAHNILMQGLIPQSGQYRKTGVGIVKGDQLTHVAPPAKNIPYLMKDLFHYLKTSDDHIFIKSCVFHYEMEFIHPFADGNGRMGRLWQTLLLVQEFPLFEFLPFETLISKNQKAYYKALANSDKSDESTQFITFILSTINTSLDELLKERIGPVSSYDRMQIFIAENANEFSRKDYLNYFKNISTATASRDLNKAVKEELILKIGDKNNTKYKRTNNI
ncbi:MAG: cell filamentation protein Fic [Sphingobacteriia bacterium 24-36-13]|jgi:Fic family protein|uniref:Fic family protein n=1 Tax=Sediminibacterium sp. TaxID=1917865 RepID=UPI000BDB902C|nr:Fic family protein [Sediminibacterium sp.]OYY08876.1 MAG: cell filamentation protein Fic [Sphingobacteriia bacterium 35-36-14]OYZ53999.1 MAG: cell filamentation protein Fic [Sphingobacteriia bacterium 24-36-13]OZA64995.1 MAG: cell filamentation protein Fic [Sphingobacteriia bacterium 39-36-14]HQS25184.1 Fic family protein [Sediminibacterium sp.]HQS35887.1 Fic family protein [Sediminibacterium sp.]